MEKRTGFRENRRLIETICRTPSDSAGSRQLPFLSVLMSCATMTEAICEQQINPS